jgi:hypothetical protein
MRPRYLLALPLALAVVSVCGAGIGTNRFNISIRSKGSNREVFLAVADGRLTLGNSTFSSVSDNEDAADRWYITGTRIKSSTGAGYLAYDPSGRSPRVFLTPRPGKGTDWTVGIGEGAREGARGVIRAAAGKRKGWYLSVEVTRVNDGNGNTVRVRRRFILAKAPAQKLEAERIYSHK